MLVVAVTVVFAAATRGQNDDTASLIPPQLSKGQREKLLRFLHAHDRPDRFIPAGATVVDPTPNTAAPAAEPKSGASIKQFAVQITPHRPVPGQPEPSRVDIYFYRPNPEKGRPGITVKHTVDVTTGEQVGPTEVHFNKHVPMARGELEEAVALARESLPELQQLYQNKNNVRYEYLQMLITRKHEGHDPGDRVVRLVFSARPGEGQAPAPPLRVIVNLTKGVAAVDSR